MRWSIVNFNIRGAVIHNIHQMDNNELTELVEDSISQGEEKLLPGLGVLFEVIWKNSDPNERQAMIETLHDQVQK